MQKSLFDRGILLPSGEISKDKINLISGAITLPFAEMVWATTDGDLETINRLTDVLVSIWLSVSAFLVRRLSCESKRKIGARMSLGISTNLEAITARYVDVRLERKKAVLNIYHQALHPKVEGKGQGTGPKKEKDCGMEL
jgi:hypothetical protein